MAAKEKDEREQGGFKNMFSGLWAGGQKQQDPADNLEEQPPVDREALSEREKPEDTEEQQEVKQDENILPVADNPLIELYARRMGMPMEEDKDALFHLAEFMLDENAPDREQRSWLKSFERDARALLHKSKAEDEKPIDAVTLLKMSGDRMSAWLFAFPPTFEGAPLAAGDIANLLKVNGITYGINEEVIATICEKKQYFKLIPVAQGLLPQDGTDGEIIDHFKRGHEIHLTVKDDNTIDYKDLGWLQTVLEGEAVCDITAPTEAVSGINVRGDEVRGRNGRKAVPPRGQGTTLNADETALVSAIEGVLTFHSSRFRVDPLLIIRGNVDTATGNLDVVGDVLINGDIQEGFTVEATGNITVQGMIEGANVIAGGDVQVGRGMNGNSHGVIQAKKEVRCKYIENGTVTAGSKIVCDTIINSTISSDSAVEVKTGRGAIIGGSVTALERIDALSIGNQANRSIAINMGSTANFLREKYELEQKRKSVADDIMEMEKSTNFLEMDNTKSARVAKMLDDLKLKLTVQKMQLANLDRQLLVMQRKQTDNASCRIRAEVVFPPVQITIGSFSKVIRQTTYNALIYLKDGEIHVANV